MSAVVIAFPAPQQKVARLVDRVEAMERETLRLLKEANAYLDERDARRASGQECRT